MCCICGVELWLTLVSESEETVELLVVTVSNTGPGGKRMGDGNMLYACSIFKVEGGRFTGYRVGVPAAEAATNCNFLARFHRKGCAV